MTDQEKNEAPTKGDGMLEFTIRKGLGFTREEDGSVTIRVQSGDWSKAVNVEYGEWCSIVAHVSVGGGTADDFYAAEELHIGGSHAQLNLGCRPLARGQGIGGE